MVGVPGFDAVEDFVGAGEFAVGPPPFGEVADEGGVEVVPGVVVPDVGGVMTQEVLALGFEAGVAGEAADEGGDVVAEVVAVDVEAVDGVVDAVFPGEIFLGRGGVVDVGDDGFPDGEGFSWSDMESLVDFSFQASRSWRRPGLCREKDFDVADNRRGCGGAGGCLGERWWWRG